MSSNEGRRHQSPASYATAALTEALLECNRRGLRLTALRQRLLEVLWQAGKPLGAYEVLPLLTPNGGQKLTAATVYRSLDFLVANGFAHRIESRNAFVVCPHPGHAHACLFLLCTSCGGAVEVENAGIEGLVEREAASRGFRVRRPVMEVEGTCSVCAIPPGSRPAPSALGAA